MPTYKFARANSVVIIETFGDPVIGLADFINIINAELNMAIPVASDPGVTDRFSRVRLIIQCDLLNVDEDMDFRIYQANKFGFLPLPDQQWIDIMWPN